MAILRVVHPPGQQGPRSPKWYRSGALSLTDEEVRHLRAANRNAVRAYGNSEALASVLGVPRRTVHRATAENGDRPSGTFAIRLAMAAGMSVEAILTGQLSAAGRCDKCCSRMDDRAERRAV